MAMEKLPSLERATEIVDKIIADRKRWGKAAGNGGFNQHDVVDALVVIFGSSNTDGPTKAELAQANRRLGAANAREAGLKKLLDDVKFKLAEATQHRDSIGEQLKRQDLAESVLQEELRQQREANDITQTALRVRDEELAEAMAAVDIYSERVSALRDYIATLDGFDTVSIKGVVQFLDGKFARVNEEAGIRET